MSSTKSSLLPSEYSPLSIARMLWKSKLVVLAVWVAVTIVAGTIVWFWPSTYMSEAVVLVDSQKIPERYVSSTVSAELQDRIATISQQILSSPQLKKVIEDFDLYRRERASRYEEEILEMMRKDISVKLEKGWTANRPGAFRVGYRGSNPQVVAQVANRIANLYIEENLKSREVQAEGTSEFLQTQVRNAKRRLDELESAVSTYKLKHNGALPEQQSMLMGVLSRLQAEMEANRDAINRTQQNKIVLENTLRILEASVAARQWEIDHPEQAPVVTASGAVRPPAPKPIDVLQAQLNALRIRYSEDYPDVKRIREEIDRLKRMEEAGNSLPGTGDVIAKAEAADEPAADARLVPASAASPAAITRKGLDLNQERLRISGLKAELALNAKEADSRNAEQQRIRRDLGAWQKKIDELPVREREFAEVTRDYEISKANYKSLLDKMLSADVATDLERRQKSERFTLLDAARVPEKPIKPDRPLLMALGCFLGLLIALAAGIGNEIRSDLFLGEWELPPNTVVLARLPQILHGAAPFADPEGGKPGLLRPGGRSAALASVLGLVAAVSYLIWRY